MINEESVSDSKVACHSKKIPYDAIFSDLVNSNEIDDGDECVTVDEPLYESLVNLVKFDADYLSHEEWLILMHERHLIDELLFGEKKSSFAYTNKVKDNLIEPSKEVEDMKQPVVIVVEAENEDYYATSEARKKYEERKSLLEEKNEKNQYGSSYDFSYDCNNVF
jgi:hypothetical protein